MLFVLQISGGSNVNEDVDTFLPYILLGKHLISCCTLDPVNA